MTSYKIKSKFLSTQNNNNTNKSVEVAVATPNNATNGEIKTTNKIDSLLRARNSVNNSSGSSIKSTSSESSFNLSATNDTLNNVKIIFPNGFETVKSIDSKKAIYDLLIELSASAKLIPTNYMLKLYSQDENNNIYNDEKLIEYTPNQTIGQLNPTKIKILPKTATLKHHHTLQDVNSTKINSSIYNNSSKNSNQNSTFSSATNSNKPFELTKCVQVNLPFNQKTIVRVKPEIKLADLFDLICKEANLDRQKYDLIILNHTINSWQDSFDIFDTKEVNLVLKQKQQQHTVNINEQSKLLNSKSTHSIFVQNSSNTKKSKINTLSSNNNNNNNAKTLAISNQDSLLRSKSEVEIKVESNIMKPSEMGNKLQENNYVITPAKLTFKKKTAPPPPPSHQHQQSLSSNTLKQNESISTKDKIDEVSISKFITSNKRKAPAPPPPPPPSSQQQQLEKKETELINDQLKIETIFNSSPKSQHSDYSSSLLLSETNQDNQKIDSSSSTTSSSPPLPESNYSIPSSPASSVCLHNNNLNDKKSEPRPNSLIMPVVKTHIHYNTAIQKYHNSLNPTGVTSPAFNQNKKSSECLSNIKDKNENNVIVARKLSMQSISSDIEDSFETSVTSGSSSKLDKYHDDQQICHEIESIIENELGSLNNDNINITNNKEISIHSSSLSIYNSNNSLTTAAATTKNDKSIDESLLLQSNLRGKFYGKLSDQKTFSEDDFSDIDSIKASNSPMLSNNSKFMSLQHIEVSRYQQYLNKSEDFDNQTTPTTIFETKSFRNDLNNNNLNETIKEDREEQQLKTNSKKLVQAEKRPELNKLKLVQTAEPNDYVKIKSINKKVDDSKSQVRTIVSPVPQFPAIGADELNEQHANYTVVRSGEIIEKNGTYYSTDGTVRGYSGTVKKIANSKTLNEIFTKQIELEKQHELEYQLELEQKQKQEEELQKKFNSLEQYKQQQLLNVQKRQSLQHQPNSNSYSKGRTSLNNIIMNEKNSKSNTLSTYTTMVFKQKNTTENELAKKLEERASKIAAASNTNKPLEIDTNLKSSESTSNSSSSSFVTNQASVSSSSSASSTNASSTMISPHSPSRQRAAYTKIYDLKNEHSKIHETSSSSSSSLSTFSYEPLKSLTPKPFTNQYKSNTLNTTKINTKTINNKNLNTKPIDYHSMLLNEIKSVVPLVEEMNSTKKIETKTASLIKLAKPDEANITTSQSGLVKPPPPPPINPPQVAPKNFSPDAIKSLNKKTQVINTRDNLLDSIRSFSVASLRKVDLN